jgi:hypothetical protein
MSVTPERDDRPMPVELPRTCAACGVPTERVAPGTPIPACGYHGGVAREEAE